MRLRLSESPKMWQKAFQTPEHSWKRHIPATYRILKFMLSANNSFGGGWPPASAKITNQTLES